jgi:serine/threonine protein phosphatase PrpC
MKLVVLGSDGLWEFLSPQAVIDVCAQVGLLIGWEWGN